MCVISLLRPLQLGLPVVDVRLREVTVSTRKVLMPEAAVDKYGCRVALEHNVGSPRQTSDVLPEPESAAMEIRSYAPLR